MARVSAHGRIIGSIEYIASTRRFMSDGWVLHNAGTGWKLYGRVKAGLTPEVVFKQAQERHQARLQANPALAEYRRQLHALAPSNRRWKLHLAVSMLPNDPDGVWSEACDGYADNVQADVNEIVRLCQAYQATVAAKGEANE